MTEADTFRIVLPVLVSHEHQHKLGVMIADLEKSGIFDISR